jgi:hypothetical protein
MLEEEGDIKGASGNMELLRTGVPQSVFLKSHDGTISAPPLWYIISFSVK